MMSTQTHEEKLEALGVKVYTNIVPFQGKTKTAKTKKNSKTQGKTVAAVYSNLT